VTDDETVRVGEVAWVLGAHLRAVANLLEQSGDITPYGAGLIRRTVAEHLPGVTWEDT
jgi:hypothetical protein